MLLLFAGSDVCHCHFCRSVADLQAYAKAHKMKAPNRKVPYPPTYFPGWCNLCMLVLLLIPVVGLYNSDRPLPFPGGHH